MQIIQKKITTNHSPNLHLLFYAKFGRNLKMASILAAG